MTRLFDNVRNTFLSTISTTNNKVIDSRGFIRHLWNVAYTCVNGRGNNYK